MNLTCNSTLEDLRILPGSEREIVGSLTFHSLALIIAGASTLVAIVMSLYLIMQHALHYTKPREQKHIIRILFMVPVYATSSFLSLRFYWHAVYFQVISDCYEAFAISSFFALMCHYMAPDLHDQKHYFRQMRPVKPWVWPLNWFMKCCGGERGPWRTPQSGLTWFNIVWVGIYHYCFIRVAMTITAVVTQYFHRYCESSNNPVFAHIWVISLNCVAVTIAMYCVIQFYVQLKEPLAEHKPFLKVLAIKLVIFLSFWQVTAISVGTSTLDLVHPNEVLAYPDIKIGIPSLLLCFEMAWFAILHLWAFPYRPYVDNAPKTFYPVADPDSGLRPKENQHYPRAGGFLGLAALWDALNVWDIVKAFGRGIRWLFCGVKNRHNDASYRQAGKDMDDLSRRDGGYAGGRPGAKSTDHLPIATEFRRSRFEMLYHQQQQKGLDRLSEGTETSSPHPAVAADKTGPARGSDEAAGLIEHAQPMSSHHARQQQYGVALAPDSPAPHYQRPYRDEASPGPYQGPPAGYTYDHAFPQDTGYSPRDSPKAAVGRALWGSQSSASHR